MTEKIMWGADKPWKTKSSWFSYLRGCLRKCWSKHPEKLNLLKKMRKQIPNPNPKGNKATVWGATCAMCGNDFVIKDIQVDHIVPAGQLNKTEDIQGFVERLLYVREEDLRCCCKNCNNALALSERMGITFEQALIQKQIIALQKAKQDVDFIRNHDYTPASNQAKRKQQLIEILTKEQDCPAEEKADE